MTQRVFSIQLCYNTVARFNKQDKAFCFRISCLIFSNCYVILLYNRERVRLKPMAELKIISDNIEVLSRLNYRGTFEFDFKFQRIYLLF